MRPWVDLDDIGRYVEAEGGVDELDANDPGAAAPNALGRDRVEATRERNGHESDEREREREHDGGGEEQRSAARPHQVFPDDIDASPPEAALAFTSRSTTEIPAARRGAVSVSSASRSSGPKTPFRP